WPHDIRYTTGVTPKSICIGPAWPDMANKNDWQSANAAGRIKRDYQDGEPIMKKLGMLGIIGAAAILTAAPLSLQWSQTTLRRLRQQLRLSLRASASGLRLTVQLSRRTVQLLTAFRDLLLRVPAALVLVICAAPVVLRAENHNPVFPCGVIAISFCPILPPLCATRPARGSSTRPQSAVVTPVVFIVARQWLRQ